MSMMHYKGYPASIHYDAGNEIFYGIVEGINDSISFHSDSVDGLKKEFARSIDFYLECCEKHGDVPERPGSGRLMVRIAPAIHGAALTAAAKAGESLNKWVEGALAQAAGVETQSKTAHHKRSSHSLRATRLRGAA